MGARDAETLNGDRALTPDERRAYFRHGWREIREDVGDPGLVQARAEALASTHTWSPFRAYSDAVLAETLESLDEPPREVVDVGCGSGTYARWFKDGEGTYHGVDIVPDPAWCAVKQESARWRRRVVFHQVAGEMLDELQQIRADFSFSCSALEHVDDPDAAIRGLATCSRPGAYGLHIVPAPWSLILYGPHGWRRFSSARLRTLFTDAGFEVIRIYRLGGVPSLLLHFVWITGLESGRALEFATGSLIPSVVSRVLAHVRYQKARMGRVLGRIYRGLLRAALRLDRYCPRMPVGYAVVVRRSGSTVV